MNPSDLPEEDEVLMERLNPREKPMGFFEHLEDLRWTLIKCAITFCVFAAGIGFFLKEFNDVLLWPLNYVRMDYPKFVVELGTTSIMEGFSVIIQMCCSGGIIMALPFMLYFAGQFVAPALSEKELKVLLPVCLASFLLFVMGACFSFFLLVPSTIRVSIEINELLGYAVRWTPGAYYNLLMWMVLGVGASFEFPLLILLAIYLGFLTVETLRRYRRHAIIVIFIIAAVVTPTPDPFVQCMFAAPLYILYELSIIIGSRLQARRSIG